MLIKPRGANWPGTAIVGSWLAVLASYAAVDAQDAKPDNAATRDYAVAVGLENKRLFPQAAARWQKFIDAHPGEPRLDRAHYHLATCQLESGEPEKAAAAYRHLLASFPQFKDRDAAQCNLAMALYQSALKAQQPQAWKAAAEAFGQVPANYPQSTQVPTALYYQGEALYAAGEREAAIKLYEKIIHDHSASDMTAQARLALGAAQQEMGQGDAAVETFRAFIAKHAAEPRVHEARLRLGLALLGRRKYAEAAEQLGQAAGAANFALADLALLRQAQCLAEQKKSDQAVGLYQSLPGKFPQSKYIGPAQIAAGKLLYDAEKYQPAQQALVPAVAAANESSAEAAYWLAKTLLKLNQVPGALAELEKAIAAYPNSEFRPWLELGRIDTLYELPERRKETVALYQQFAQQHPEHELAPQAAYRGALSALAGGDYAEATRQAAHFLANEKWHEHALLPEVMFVSAESLLLAGGADDAAPRAQKAEPQYRQLIEKFPQHRHVPACRVRLGLCLYLQSKYDAAVAHLTQNLAQLNDAALQAEAHFTLGRAHHDARRWPQAEAALREAVRVKPDWPRLDELLLALAAALQAENKLDEAAAELNRVVSGLPNSAYRPQALFELGELYERRQKHDEAIRQFEQVLSQYAEGIYAASAAYGLARAKFAKEDAADAVEAATIVVDRFASSDVAASALYLRGLARQRLKQYQPASADFEAFLSRKPSAGDAHDARYALALCQLDLKQYEQAAATLKLLLDEAPKYARADQAYYELGFALSAAQHDQAAAEAWKTLATKFPQSELAGDAWFRVGEYHERRKEWKPAGEAYQHGRQRAKTPELQEKLQFKLGWVQYQAEHFGQAAAAFRAQLESFPAGALLADATYLAGESLYRQKQYQPALERFAQAIAQSNDKYLARALYRAGDCATQLKQWNVSQERYQTLLNQFPKFELIGEARYGLGWAQQNQGQLAEAKQTYEQVTKETDSETAAKARFMIGECAFREKKYDEAVEHYLTAALGYPYEEWQALGYLEAGRCLIELKDPAKARDMLETVVKQYPKHPKAKDAARLIKSIK